MDLETKDIVTLAISGLALLVSVTTAISTFFFNKRKAARDLWQRNLELYMSHPAHVLGRPKSDSEEDEQVYRIHVSYIFLAFEELLSAFPRDAGWLRVIRRHIQRHAEYARIVLADKDRLSMYSSALQAKMKEALNAPM
ncbi:MAG: hypothetical protein JWP49_2770 [Phenylobacterium sp.]|nr:hypothetical protein [Phenylobacterium sp.]